MLSRLGFLEHDGGEHGRTAMRSLLDVLRDAGRVGPARTKHAHRDRTGAVEQLGVDAAIAAAQLKANRRKQPLLQLRSRRTVLHRLQEKLSVVRQHDHPQTLAHSHIAREFQNIPRISATTLLPQFILSRFILNRNSFQSKLVSKETPPCT